MTTIRRINVSQIDGNDANVNDTNEIRPFGETAFYLDTDQNPDSLALMMFDGVRTHLRSKVLRPGVLYGSNEDSSDGLGYDTIKLIPDSFMDWNSEYTNDQYIIIEPTAGEPPHVHIRSGGTIDNSTADLLLGGELNHVRVSDANNRVVISTDAGEGGTEFWNFGGDGKLTLPTGGVIGPYGMGWTGITNGTAGTPISIAHLSNADGSELSSVNLSSNNGEAGQVSIFARTANTSNEWIFSEDGSLTLPGGSAQVVVEGDAGVRISTADLNVAPSNHIKIGGADHAFEIFGGPPGYSWAFDVDGTTSFPSGLILAPAGQSVTMQSDQYSQLMYQNADVSETPNIAINTNFFVAPNFATLDIVYRDGGSNQQTKSWLWNIEGLTFPDNTVQTTAWGGGSVVLAPNTSIGDSTDVEGRIAFDSTYFYYCTANYNGSDNIWKRVAWSMDTW